MHRGRRSSYEQNDARERTLNREVRHCTVVIVSTRMEHMIISPINVHFDEDAMWVELTDGRTLGVPLAWFPRLLRATRDERDEVELSRVGLHWEALDEDISITGLLAGRCDVTHRTIDAASPGKR